MSVENGFIRHKKHIKQENGTYKSISYWTSSNSVEMDSGNTLQEEFDLIDIQTSNDGTCPGSIDGGGLKLEMTGKTEQKTMTGKNFIANEHITAFKGCNVANGIITQSSTDSSTGFNLKCLAYMNNTVINANLMSSTQITKTGKYQFTFNKTSEFNKLVFGHNGKEQDVTCYINVDHLPDGEYTLQCNFTNVTQGSYSWKDIQIEAGEVATDYEPYCGGIPSPNPDYPQVIENVGDCVEMMQGYYSITTGAYGTTPESICSKRPIPCKGGDVVKVTTETIMEAIYIMYYGENGYISYSTVANAKEHEFTLPSNATSFNIRVDKTPITPQTVGKIALTVNDKYVGQIVEHGKNLLKNTAVTQTVDGFSFTVNDDKSITISGTATKNIYYVINDNFVFESNNEYKISGCRGGSSVSYMIGCVDNNYTVHYWDAGKGTILKNINKNYKIVFFAYAGTKFNTTIYPMITLNTETDQSYEPYTEHVATFFLDEPLREGDRLVKVDGVWNVERNTTEDILDGIDEYWEEGTNNFSVNRSKKRGGTHGVYCSHFKQGTSLDTVGTVKEGSGETNLYIYFSKGTFTTLAEWKEWLQSNPITVQYRLATPTLTPLDLESQIALNDMVTFNGVTYIEVDSKIQPSGIEVEYGTSKVSGIALKNELRHDTQDIIIAEQNAKIEELTTALLMLNQE